MNSDDGSTLEELHALLVAHDALLFYDAGFNAPGKTVRFSLAPAAARAGKVLRADLIALAPAREVSAEQLEAERQADRAVEECNEAFLTATLPADRDGFGRPPTKKQRAQALARHGELLSAIEGLVARGIPHRRPPSLVNRPLREHGPGSHSDSGGVGPGRRPQRLDAAHSRH